MRALSTLSILQKAALAAVSALGLLVSAAGPSTVLAGGPTPILDQTLIVPVNTAPVCVQPSRSSPYAVCTPAGARDIRIAVGATNAPAVSASYGPDPSRGDCTSVNFGVTVRASATATVSLLITYTEAGTGAVRQLLNETRSISQDQTLDPFVCQGPR